MNPKAFSWADPSRLEVKKVGFGKGVFAKKNFKKNDLILIFGGYVFAFEEELSFPKELSDFALQISPEFVIGIRSKSEFQELVENVNHSCNPNCGIKGQIFLVAMRNIARGEQITFDYCMVLSRPKKTKWNYHFNCRCNSKNCRKVVTWDDWKRLDLQKRYKGYFSLYLEEKIKKIMKS